MENKARNPVPPLEPTPRDGILPATFMQEQLWFLQQLEPASDAYNVPAAIRLKGRLDLKALQQSFDMILRGMKRSAPLCTFPTGISADRGSLRWRSRSA